MNYPKITKTSILYIIHLLRNLKEFTLIIENDALRESIDWRLEKIYTTMLSEFRRHPRLYKEIKDTYGVRDDE